MEAKFKAKKHDIATLRAQHNKDVIVNLVESAILLRYEKMAKQTFRNLKDDSKLSFVKEKKNDEERPEQKKKAMKKMKL